MHKNGQVPPIRGGIAMEKKTIGKFISALRRANGMTQKELGEKLFVSDKTVSRWERDECTPELSLIPAIAELFGITTDELLRGERKNFAGECMDDEVMHAKLKAKSEKQFKAMLRSSRVKYQNLSFIAVGISVTGLLAAMICNLGFTRAVLGFGLGCIFLLISIIFQVCNVTGKLIPLAEEDEKQNFEIRKTNVWIIERAVCVTLVNAGEFGFLLPLVLLSEGGNTGLTLGAWTGFGALGMLAVSVTTYVVYVLLFRGRMFKKEHLLPDEKYMAWMRADKRIMKKILMRSGVIALALGIAAVIVSNLDAHLFVNPIVFETIPEFQAYMLENQNTHFENGEDIVISGTDELLANENAISHAVGIIDESTGNIQEGANWSQVFDREGNVMFSYAAGDFYYLIKSDAVDGVPIEVYLKRDRAEVWQIQELIVTILLGMIVVEFIGSFIIYVNRTWKEK